MTMPMSSPACHRGPIDLKCSSLQGRCAINRLSALRTGPIFYSAHRKSVVCRSRQLLSSPAEWLVSAQLGHLDGSRRTTAIHPERTLGQRCKNPIFATAAIGNRPKVVGDMLQSFATVQLVLCRRPTAVPSCHKEAATTRLLPGKNDALPSAAVAVCMPLPQVR